MPDHPQTRRRRHNTAMLLQDQGRFAEAEEELRALLQAHRRIYGDDHDTTLRSVSALAMVLMRQERFGEAEPHCREAFETRQRVNGPEFDLTLLAQSALAHALTKLGRHAEAEALYAGLRRDRPPRAAREPLAPRHLPAGLLQTPRGPRDLPDRSRTLAPPHHRGRGEARRCLRVPRPARRRRGVASPVGRNCARVRLSRPPRDTLSLNDPPRCCAD